MMNFSTSSLGTLNQPNFLPSNTTQQLSNHQQQQKEYEAYQQQLFQQCKNNFLAGMGHVVPCQLYNSHPQHTQQPQQQSQQISQPHHTTNQMMHPSLAHQSSGQVPTCQPHSNPSNQHQASVMQAQMSSVPTVSTMPMMQVPNLSSVNFNIPNNQQQPFQAVSMTVPAAQMSQQTLTNLMQWTIHLQYSPQVWKAMQPEQRNVYGQYIHQLQILITHNPMIRQQFIQMQQETARQIKMGANLDYNSIINPYFVNAINANPNTNTNTNTNVITNSNNTNDNCNTNSNTNTMLNGNNCNNNQINWITPNISASPYTISNSSLSQSTRSLTTNSNNMTPSNGAIINNNLNQQNGFWMPNSQTDPKPCNNDNNNNSNNNNNNNNTNSHNNGKQEIDDVEESGNTDDSSDEFMHEFPNSKETSCMNQTIKQSDNMVWYVSNLVFSQFDSVFIFLIFFVGEYQ